MVNIKTLKNSYYVMRHGQSLANIQGIIVSDPENGLAGYGLTQAGKQQAVQSLKNFPLDSQTIIYSSDFLRTQQTALIAEEILEPHHRIIFTKHLRERFFGDFELTSSDNYETVWAQDCDDHTALKNNVEPVTDVLRRGLLCLMEIEDRFCGKNILWVSHGDTLQILLAFFRDWLPNRHRDVPHMGVAEIRKV